jgi:phospholipid-translocating ATPase
MWTFALFWYLPFNGYVDLFTLKGLVLIALIFRFDATYLYQYTFIILLYNLVFTSLPVIILGG